MSENNENQQTQERRPHFVKTIGKTKCSETFRWTTAKGGNCKGISFKRKYIISG